MSKYESEFDNLNEKNFGDLGASEYDTTPKGRNLGINKSQQLKKEQEEAEASEALEKKILEESGILKAPSLGSKDSSTATSQDDKGPWDASMNLLEVEHLSVSFHTYAGEVKAIRDISFSLKEQETLAIVGESGCGKSITAKSINCLLPKDITDIKPESKIYFKNENVLKFNKKRLKDIRGGDIGMIFQDPMTSLNPTMRIGTQIEEVLKIHRNLSRKEIHDEIVHLLRLVNIPSPEARMRQYPHEFSGGQRQRIVIAIALACHPKILIADEPTTALDVTIQAEIMNLIDNLKHKLKTAVILITHDLGVVFEHADKIQVMYAGTIVERGSVDEIFKKPKHPYTWALLKSIPTLETRHKEELYSIQGTPPNLLGNIVGCPFAPRCDYMMEVCKMQKPEETTINEGHKASCWLLHPFAPKVAMMSDEAVK